MSSASGKKFFYKRISISGLCEMHRSFYFNDFSLCNFSVVSTKFFNVHNFMWNYVCGLVYSVFETTGVY